MSTRDSQSFSILTNYIHPETLPSTELTVTGWPVYKLVKHLLAAKTGNLFPTCRTGIGWSIKHILHIFVPDLINIPTETPTTSAAFSLALCSTWQYAILDGALTSGSGSPVPLHFAMASLSFQNLRVEEAEKYKQPSICLTVYRDTGLQVYCVPAL